MPNPGAWIGEETLNELDVGAWATPMRGSWGHTLASLRGQGPHLSPLAPRAGFLPSGPVPEHRGENKLRHANPIAEGPKGLLRMAYKELLPSSLSLFF